MSAHDEEKISGSRFSLSALRLRCYDSVPLRIMRIPKRVLLDGEP